MVAVKIHPSVDGGMAPAAKDCTGGALVAPVAPIAGFRTLDDVLDRANAVPYGLAGYVFTHDAALADLNGEGLEVGMVGVNETMLATAEAPFGGVKESGFGREGGALGIKDYHEPKYVRRKLVTQGAPA